MAAAIKISRDDLDPAGLRRAARRAGSVAASRRMLALALVLEGTSRTEAAQVAGMDRQTLSDWVHRYNEAGPAGLTDRQGDVGPRRRLSPEQESEVAEWVRRGPDLAEHGVVRWRRADLARAIEAKFGVVLAERSISTVLRRLGFRRLVVRPRHPGQDAAAQASFKPACGPRRGSPAGARPRQAAGNLVGDEARIGQQGTLTRIWAERGSRPSAPRDQRYDWAYLFGAICPARGLGAALVLPTADAAMMNLHLAEISAAVTPGAHAVLILDGAGWHQSGGRLRVPGNITLLHLPPYSPELNPVENVWAYLRGNALSNRVFDTYDDIVDACCSAWNRLTAQPERITSIGTRKWACVSQ